MSKSVYQEKLDEIIKTTINPLFKIAGFKKSGRNYYKDMSGFFLCFNIQSSIYNSQEEIRFTFNTGVFLPESCKIYFGERLPEFPKELYCIRRTRIGHLKGIGDYWYKIHQDIDLNYLRKEIDTDLKDYVFPYFESLKTLEDIENLHSQISPKGDPQEVALYSIFLIQRGKTEGIQLLRDHFNNAYNEGYKFMLKTIAQDLNVEL
jgi:hypothetical protein